MVRSCLVDFHMVHMMVFLNLLSMQPFASQTSRCHDLLCEQLSDWELTSPLWLSLDFSTEFLTLLQ